MSKNVLIVAAHPDDEALGCGGTLFKMKEAGFNINFVFMTDGVGSRSTSDKGRQLGIKKAMDFVGVKSVKFLGYPDNKLDTVPLLDIVKSINATILEIKPNLIFTHFIGDLNIDHVLTCRAVTTASRPGEKTFVKNIFSFEVPSSTEWGVGADGFRPNTYSDISDCINLKRDYLKCYAKEMREPPYTRSIKNILALNQVRGGHINVSYAEAFMTLRCVFEPMKFD
jgi:LmbE family N-acetylglucosaminyl deacetylase